MIKNEIELIFFCSKGDETELMIPFDISANFSRFYFLVKKDFKRLKSFQRSTNSNLESVADSADFPYLK
jgi:hypothetical protein